MTSTTESDDLVIDTALLREVLWSNARKWLRVGIIFIVLAGLLALAVIPQSFTSTATVVVQQSTGDASALAMLAGGKQNARYLGVLKSRTAAETVLRSTRFLELYPKVKRRSKQILVLQKALKVDDDAATGMLNISVTVPGAPKLTLNYARTKLAQQVAADVANAYVGVLRSYYTNSDNDREAVILRTADAECTQSRAGYEASIRRLTTFAASLKKVDPRSIPNPGKADGPPAGDELGELYSALAKVETQLIAQEASQGATSSFTGQELDTVNDLPSEDPLLTSARSHVAQDQAELQALSVTYGPDYPAVILAKNQLDVDRAALRAQISGVKRQKTSEQLLEHVTIENLSAQRQSLEDQITVATARLSTGRNLSAVLERLKAEVDIQLTVLKTTLSEAAKARMLYASVQSRITVIDPAIPDDQPTPSGLIIAMGVVGLALLVYIVASVLDYARISRSRQSAGTTLTSQTTPDAGEQAP